VGMKRPERGVGHPPPLRADAKERVELHIYFPSGRLWHVLGWNLRFVVVVAAAAAPLPLLLQLFHPLFLHYTSSTIYWRSWYCFSRKPIQFMVLGGG